MLQQSLALISLRAFNVQEYNMSTNVLCLSKTFEETFLPLLPLKIILRNLLIMWFSNIFLCDQNPSAWSHMRNFELRSKQNTSCCYNSRMFPAMCVTVWLTARVWLTCRPSNPSVSWATSNIFKPLSHFWEMQVTGADESVWWRYLVLDRRWKQGVDANKSAVILF